MAAKLPRDLVSSPTPAETDVFVYDDVSVPKGPGVETVRQLTTAELRTILLNAAASLPNTPAGNIAATDAQAAINELDSEKAGVALANIFTALNTFPGLRLNPATDTDIPIDFTVAPTGSFKYMSRWKVTSTIYGRRYATAIGYVETINARWTGTNWAADSTASAAAKFAYGFDGAFRVSPKANTAVAWLDTAWDTDRNRSGSIAEYAIGGSTAHNSGILTLTETINRSGYTIASNLVQVPEAGTYRIRAQSLITHTNVADPVDMKLELAIGTARPGTVIGTGYCNRYIASSAWADSVGIERIYQITTPAAQKILVYFSSANAGTLATVGSTANHLLIERVQ